MMDKWNVFCVTLLVLQYIEVVRKEVLEPSIEDERIAILITRLLDFVFIMYNVYLISK
jgi:predicted membrane protein